MSVSTIKSKGSLVTQYSHPIPKRADRDVALSEYVARERSNMESHFGGQGHRKCLTISARQLYPVWTVTVIVTGANRGIGLGVADVCLGNDAKDLYSLGVSKPGEDFEALCERRSDLQFILADVTSERSVEEALEIIVRKESHIDEFVANAGIAKHQPALDFSWEQVEELFKLNVRDACTRVVPQARAATDLYLSLRVFGTFSGAPIPARKFEELGVRGSIAFTASMTCIDRIELHHPLPTAAPKLQSEPWPMRSLWNRLSTAYA